MEAAVVAGIVEATVAVEVFGAYGRYCADEGFLGAFVQGAGLGMVHYALLNLGRSERETVFAIDVRDEVIVDSVREVLKQFGLFVRYLIVAIGIDQRIFSSAHESQFVHQCVCVHGIIGRVSGNGNSPCLTQSLRAGLGLQARFSSTLTRS